MQTNCNGKSFLPGESRLEPAWQGYRAYGKFLGDRVTGGAALQGVETATTIRLRDGEQHVEDGPFADTKERLGGFYLVEAANLDEAMEMAKKAPSAPTGSVAIRPFGSHVSEARSSSVAAAERSAREAYGRLVALLTRRTGDVAGAEDALGDAFVAALERWPKRGVPDHPEAWLLAVARRRRVDAHRRQAVRDRSQNAIEDVFADLGEADGVPDRRLQLFYMCAHPSIDAAVRAPLMLQVVLGLSAEQIGRAFLVSAAAMGQRLSRAKRKIRAARIPFEPPDADLRERTGIVLEAVYAAFSTGYDGTGTRHGLVDEAIWLGRVAHQQSGRHPKAAGLLALMLHVEARRPARCDEEGRFVPLERQDPSRWDPALVGEAERLLWEDADPDAPGLFQLEAAVQSVHAHRRITGHTDWVAIEALYRRLLEQTPTLGARVAHIAAVAEVHGSETAYGELRQIDPSSVRSHQPYWVLRAHLERLTGLDPRASIQHALALTPNPTLRTHLETLDDGCSHPGPSSSGSKPR